MTEKYVTVKEFTDVCKMIIKVLNSMNSKVKFTDEQVKNLAEALQLMNNWRLEELKKEDKYQ